VAKYTFLHAGVHGSKEYNARYYTMKEISSLFAGDKKFVGIGSVPMQEEPMTMILPPDAFNTPADFKRWANASHTVYVTTEGKYNLFTN
jgi:hypothetical protein